MAAERMRSTGYAVVAPDLYGGVAANSIEEGLAIMRSIRWELICKRAHDALEKAPDTAVLAGHSMGVGVIGRTWPALPGCSGVVMLHGLADIPKDVRQGTPVAVHVADPDIFVPAVHIARWRASAKRVQICADLFTYPAVGHLYTHETLRDFDEDAAERHGGASESSWIASSR